MRRERSHSGARQVSPMPSTSLGGSEAGPSVRAFRIVVSSAPHQSTEVKQVLPDFWMMTLTFREVKSLASKGQNWHLESGLRFQGEGPFHSLPCCPTLSTPTPPCGPKKNLTGEEGSVLLPRWPDLAVTFTTTSHTPFPLDSLPHSHLSGHFL